MSHPKPEPAVARKPGKPASPKSPAKRKVKSKPDLRRATAVPAADTHNNIDLTADTDIDLSADSDPVAEAALGAALPEEEPIEVSEFHPVASDDDEATSSEEVLPGANLISIEGEPDASTDDRAQDRAQDRAIVPVDPLNRYLAEIRRFPLLTREEEAVIAKRYVSAKDPQDAYRLVTANLRLVVKIAYEFARATRNVLDLIQEGNVGLIEAVKNFDPGRGIRFPSYAVWWVRAYIYRYLINNWRLVKIGTTQAQRKLFFNLRKETERLEAAGFKPQPLLLANRMGVKESEVREMQERMGQSEVSLDQPVNSGGEDTRLLDVIPDIGGDPESETAHREWRDFAHEKVEQFAATLEGKELEIFKARLLAEDPETLQEIGGRFGISRERVRQIETRLKRQLKEYIRKAAPDIDDAGPS